MKRASLLAVYALLLCGSAGIGAIAPAEGQQRTLTQVATIEDTSNMDWRYNRPTSHFSRDGRVFAALLKSDDPRKAGEVVFRAWDARDGRLFASWKLRFLSEFAFSPDERYVATISGQRQRYGVGYDYAVEVRDARTGTKLRTLVPTRSEKSAFSAITWSDDGRSIAVGGGGGRVLVFDVRSGQARFLNTPYSFVQSLCFSPDGRFLAAGVSSSVEPQTSLYVWTLRTGTVRTLRNTQKLLATLSVRFSRDGRRLLTRRIFETINGWQPGTVVYASPSLSAPQITEPTPASADDFPQEVALSPSGHLFATVEAVNLAVGETRTGRTTRQLRFAPDANSRDAGNVVALAFSSNTTLRWVALRFDEHAYRLVLFTASINAKR